MWHQKQKGENAKQGRLRSVLERDWEISPNTKFRDVEILSFRGPVFHPFHKSAGQQIRNGVRAMIGQWNRPNRVAQICRRWIKSQRFANGRHHGGNRQPMFDTSTTAATVEIRPATRKQSQ